MRQCGLGNVQFFQKDTGTFLPASQEIYYLHAMLIAKRFEHSYVLFIQFQNHCLLESNFVDMFILVIGSKNVNVFPIFQDKNRELLLVKTPKMFPIYHFFLKGMHYESKVRPFTKRVRPTSTGVSSRASRAPPSRLFRPETNPIRTCAYRPSS